VAIVLKVSARSCSSLPRIVSVSRAVADSMLMAVSSVLLRLNIEDPQHDFIACMRDHPAGLRIYSTGDVAAEFKQLNANPV
jgi:hypothetical protein